MIKYNSFTFQKVPSTHPDLPAVITLSIGNPTSEKVQNVLSLYDTPNHYLMGCFETNKLIGVVGLEIQNTKGIINHMGVLSEHRLKGIGTALITQATHQFFLQIIDTETDDDAVNFYKKYGFKCQPFEGSYGKRYKCNYKS